MIPRQCLQMINAMPQCNVAKTFMYVHLWMNCNGFGDLITFLVPSLEQNFNVSDIYISLSSTSAN